VLLRLCALVTLTSIFSLNVLAVDAKDVQAARGLTKSRHFLSVTGLTLHDS
jgi:hypothetical protein